MEEKHMKIAREALGGVAHNLLGASYERAAGRIAGALDVAVAEERERAAAICDDSCPNNGACDAYLGRGLRCPECPGYLALEIRSGGAPATNIRSAAIEECARLVDRATGTLLPAPEAMDLAARIRDLAGHTS